MPIEVDRPAGRGVRDVADQLDHPHPLEPRPQLVELDQAAAGACGQLAALLLLGAEPLCLGQVAEASPPEAVGVAGDDEHGVAEMVEQGGSRLGREVWGEEVDALGVDPQGEVLAVAQPHLADVLAAAAEVEQVDRRQRPRHRLGREVELARRPDRDLVEGGNRRLGVGVEGAQLLDLVAQPFGTPGAGRVQPEDVDDAAADGELAGRGDGDLAPVAERHQPRHQVVAAHGVPPPQVGAATADQLRRQGGPEQGRRRGHHQQRPVLRHRSKGRQTAPRHLLTGRHPVEGQRVGGREEGEAVLPAPHRAVGPELLGLGRDQQHPAAGGLPDPPGEQAGGAGGNAADHARPHPLQTAQRRDGVELRAQRRGGHRGLSHRDRGRGRACG